MLFANEDVETPGGSVACAHFGKGVLSTPFFLSCKCSPFPLKTTKQNGMLGFQTCLNYDIARIANKTVYLENKLLLISINFSPQTQPQLSKLMVCYVFQVGSTSVFQNTCVLESIGSSNMQMFQFLGSP